MSGICDVLSILDFFVSSRFAIMMIVPKFGISSQDAGVDPGVPPVGPRSDGNRADCLSSGGAPILMSDVHEVVFDACD